MSQLKQKILDFLNLEQEIRESIGDLVRSAFTLRTELDKKLQIAKHGRVPYGYPNNSDSLVGWYFEANNIVCEWSEFWGYGGHDEGSTYLDIDFVLNTDERTNYIKRVEQEIEQVTIDRLDNARKEKEFKIACLQNELKKLES